MNAKKRARPFPLLSWSFLLLGILAIATPAHALTAVKRSFDELAALADVVLIGTVASVDSEWSENAPRRDIHSHITLRDLEVIKGTVADNTYVLRMNGGRAGGIVQEYPGAPQLIQGERYVLFIRGNRRDMFPLVGVTQGVFPLVRGDSPQNSLLVTDHEGRAVTAVSGGEVIKGGKSRAARQQALTVDAFVREIRARLVKSQGAAP